MGLYYELEERENARKKRNRAILTLIAEVAAVVLLSYLIVAFGLVRISMIGDSMQPTLSDGNSIIVNKMSFRFTKPKRNDVIVFKQSGDEHSYYNIKRVIGLPGETVQIKDGFIYINGDKLDEKYKFDAISNGGLANEEITLDAKEYFVLGDNRNASEDSRYANIGLVMKQDIVGRAWMRVSPFNFVSKISTQKEEK